MDFDLNLHIKQLLEDYLEYFPADKDKFNILNNQINNDENIGLRKNFNGHVTSSSWILSPDYKKFIVIHNINLDMWLAPGGHWEQGDNEMYNCSIREAKEETGLANIELLPWHKNNNFIPIDIDSHLIPENTKKNEKKHYHHDFKYIFTLKEFQDIELQLEEVKGYEWININNDMKEFSCNNVLKKIRKVI